MTKLNDLFDKFLSNIEPDSKAKKYAQKAHEPVRDYLKKDKDFKDYFVNSFLYGSYKRHTAVGDIKDVDIVVLTNFDTSSKEHAPQKVLSKLKSALSRYYKDPENPDYQRRSIRINEPLPDNNEIVMTLDIIPAVIVNGDDNPLLVPDREVNKWVWSHPKGHIKHTTDLNSVEYSEERFVPLVKVMKWWWKYQCKSRQPEIERPKPKGFWIECLTGENFDTNQHDWADHFTAVLKNLSAKYSAIQDVPKLKDPGLPGKYIETSMILEEFQVFMKAINESLDLAKQAYSETDELKSSELWRDVFGEQFPLYDQEETETARSQAITIPLGNYSHAKPLPWPEISISVLK